MFTPRLFRFTFLSDYCSVEQAEDLKVAIGYKGPYFRDGQRSIDAVLVFQGKRAKRCAKDLKRQKIRERFIQKLIVQGLEIEIDTVQHVVSFSDSLFSLLSKCQFLYAHPE